MKIDALREGIQVARSRSSTPRYLRQYSNLPEEQARRAVYFSELGETVKALGLSNAFEHAALSIEPTHPVPSLQLGAQLRKIQGAEAIGPKYLDLRISLLSLAMLSTYSPQSEASALSQSGLTSPLYLLDPLYGFGFFMGKDERFHNHCFALDFWHSRLKTMPAPLARALWENRSDSMLSGGALAGRLLFRDLLPQAMDAAERSRTAEIVVHSESHLAEILAALRAAICHAPDVELWFRGQERDYKVPDRGALIRLGIAPYSNIPESDLTPSLYRKYDSHLDTFELYEDLLHELAEWVSAAKKLIPHDSSLSVDFVRRQPHAASVDGLTSFQRGLILQQYGAPSTYLDITRDPLVAAWFAVHGCDRSAQGNLTFLPAEKTATDSSVRPMIFVFPLVKGAHPYLELASILPETRALRPSRQSCGLLGGAGNLARNYCARYVGLKLRLSPQFVIKDPVHASFYFPSAKEDPALETLSASGLESANRRYPVTKLKTA